MPRQTYSFVPFKPDKLREMSVAERAMAESMVRPEKEFVLDPCPLCGGRAIIEYVGTWCNAVCQKCGCSSGSYKNPVWAAKRWNTRIGGVKEDDKPSTFDVLFVQDNDLKQHEQYKPPVFKPYSGKKKGIIDLPGQMLFDFCSSSGDTSSNG